MADYLYFVQLDVPDDMESEFNRIYDDEHVPRLLTVPGVHGCTRYHLESSTVEGVARYAAMYEIDSPDVVSSARFRAEADSGEWLEKIRPAITSRASAIFKKIS